MVNTTIYLKVVGNFAELNEMYGGYSTGHYPARTTIGVATLPGNANIEISAAATTQ